MFKFNACPFPVGESTCNSDLYINFIWWLSNCFPHCSVLKDWRCNGKGYVAYRNYIRRPRNWESQTPSYQSTPGNRLLKFYLMSMSTVFFLSWSLWLTLEKLWILTGDHNYSGNQVECCNVLEGDKLILRLNNSINLSTIVSTILIMRTNLFLNLNNYLFHAYLNLFVWNTNWNVTVLLISWFLFLFRLSWSTFVNVLGIGRFCIF